MKRIRGKLTYANVVASIAIFLALGGGAYAATQLPKNSVGSKQIRRGSIAYSDLSKAAKRRLKGTRGLRGPAGPAGPTTTTLPSGQTLRGAFNIDFVAAAPDEISGDSISFGFSLPQPPKIEVVKAGQSPTASCPGSTSNPTAAPGQFCLYETASFGVSSFAICDLECNSAAFASPWGAELFVHAKAAGRTFVSGTWAVTAG
jgi:hypothetical protein